MNYYLICLLGSALHPLTYQSIHDIDDGMVVEVLLQNKKRSGVILQKMSKPSFKTLDILHVSELFYTKAQIKFAKFISQYYMCELGIALSLFISYDKAFTCKEVNREFTDTIKLSDKQTQAMEFLQNRQTALLFGDTGSGKTEIYMKLIAKTLKQGRRTIFLMPEISLTPQMQTRLSEHFGLRVVMWHSRVTKAKKQKILKQIYSGEVDIVAGARSALFTPLKDVGLIIVDEEHDDSYKSSSSPRYNARDLAVYAGKVYGANVVLGSATPSLASYKNFEFFRLRESYFISKKEYIYEPSLESITAPIISLVNEIKQKNEQSIMFIPTRANFKYLICSNCGYTYECPYCSVGMSVHNKDRALKCHYCNFTTAIPQVCPKCKEHTLRSSRLGTAEAVCEFNKLLPSLHVEQFDRDTVTTQKKLVDILKRFNDKKIDLLIGTQMLSKGHDYHDITLAVVLGLDNLLNMSDYRAREKALSSLVQIAGRSGRKKAARVLVQTFNSDFFKVYIDDYERFLQDELKAREGVYPPFKKLCRITFAHKNGLKAKEAMGQMVQELGRFKDVEIVGAGECAIFMIGGKYRFNILLRGDKSTDIIKAVTACRHDLAQIDMDPIDFS